MAVGTERPYLTTQYFRCVTPGASTARTCSSLTAEPSRLANRRAPSPGIRGTTWISTSSIKPAARYCCATFAPPASAMSFPPAARRACSSADSLPSRLGGRSRGSAGLLASLPPSAAPRPLDRSAGCGEVLAKADAPAGPQRPPAELGPGVLVACAGHLGHEGLGVRGAGHPAQPRRPLPRTPGPQDLGRARQP